MRRASQVLVLWVSVIRLPVYAVRKGSDHNRRRDPSFCERSSRSRRAGSHDDHDNDNDSFATGPRQVRTAIQNDDRAKPLVADSADVVTCLKPLFVESFPRTDDQRQPANRDHA
jgi:hypothetical protein